MANAHDLLMAQRAAMMGALPYLRRVAYLESNGNCYIDTGFKCDDTAGFKVDVMPYYGSINSRVIGSYSGSNGRWAFVFRARSGEQLNEFYFGWNAASGDLRDSQVLLNTRFNAELNFKNSRKFKVGQIEITLTDTLYANQPYNAYLFGNNQNGSVTLSDCFIGRFYSAVMTRGENVERDFIPVIDLSEVPCMYNQAPLSVPADDPSRFFYNQGTGEFTWGELAT